MERMSDLARYLAEYHPNLMTKDETDALRTWKGQYKVDTASSEFMKEKIKEGMVSDDPNVTKLLENGIKAFGENVKNRILSENKNIFLNTCPLCKAIARTPKAKQCQKCFHRWV